MEKKEDFGGIGISFCKGEEVKVIVPDVQILVEILKSAAFGPR